MKLFSFRSLSIGKKLGALIICMLVGIYALTGFFLASEEKLLMSERQQKVQNTVETTYGVLEHFHSLEAKGVLSAHQAQQSALQTIRGMRYDGSEYFWINDMTPKMVMHPIKPALDGKELSGIKDPAGKALFMEMVDVAEKQGAGFVNYMWTKPGSEKPVDKVSYIKGFKPWGWIVGSGVYVDNVHAAIMNRLMLFLAGGSGVALTLLIVGMFITRSIRNPLRKAVQVAQTVASGDLTSDIQVHSADETGQLLQALKDMNESLARTVNHVRTSSHTIAAASKQVAAGSMDLSIRAEQQASSLEETASSMEELTSTVRQNANNTNQANQLSIKASSIAEKGGEVFSEMVTTMSSINASSQKMADIIGVIDGIAFQTNILALNASVEAARAGEQGRGFAVVASEVRNLAQRSADAAREIKTLIDDSIEKVNAGNQLVETAGSTMEEVVNSIRCVHEIMKEITAANQEQSDGIEQVNQAVSQMDQATQQNAALVEEAAAAAESMQEQSVALTDAVSIFKLNAHETRALSQNASPSEQVRTSRSAISNPGPEQPKLTTVARKERRGPNRAKNVTRLPAHPAERETKEQQKVANTSFESEWEEF